MGKLKRIWNVISGFLIILFALTCMLIPEDAFLLIALIIAILLIVRGLGRVFYYLTMAHHMVGGKIILVYGLLMFDLGVFLGSIAEESAMIITIYLTVGHLIAGGINVVKSVRSRKEGFSWRMDMVQGTINILIALICIIFINSVDILVYVYSAGLIYLACVRIASAFRKTAIVYIQ